MHIFVTGATGFIGSAVVQELLKAGHSVSGLARSEESAAALKSAGAQVIMGSLEDHGSLIDGCKKADGVIHTGFIHDFSKFKESCEIDRRAIHAMGEALRGTSKALVITSGIGLLPQKILSTEEMLPSPQSVNPRVATEEAFREIVNTGINASLVRLPPSVHGKGDHGFVPILIAMAREQKASAYIGDGTNQWPAVHRFDAAKLFVLALIKARAGAQYHGVAEEGVPFKKIADVIGKHLTLPVVSLSPEEATKHFTWFTHFAAIDAPSSSQQTRLELGWKPEQISLLDDIDQAYYFLGK